MTRCRLDRWDLEWNVSGALLIVLTDAAAALSCIVSLLCLSMTCTDLAALISVLLLWWAALTILIWCLLSSMCSYLCLIGVLVLMAG